MSAGEGQVPSQSQAKGASAPSRLGRYELITRIGQGGMADVQLALQRGPAGFEKLVVVKLVHEKLASEKAFVDMLLDEARVAALLKHPNVVDIYDLGEADGRYFIAMEYLEGEPLLAVLRAGRDGKRLDVHSTARLIADTAEGLEAAHELRSMAGKPLQLVHHDVSLGNIVVLYNGGVKLVDFGVAKATQSASTRAKVQGKYSYMAPEKLNGREGDRRSDIFSLGVVLWEALTLRRLFKGNNDDETMKQVLEAEIPKPSAVNGDVPSVFDDVVMRALSRDETTRYQTAKELADDLEEILTKFRYARKNDAIAKYMQETFKPHIEARKKLLQEVSSKGTATEEVLKAAFVPAAVVASGSPADHEFSVKFRRATIEQMPIEPATGTPTHTPNGTPVVATAARTSAPTLPPPPGVAVTVVDGREGVITTGPDGRPRLATSAPPELAAERRDPTGAINPSERARLATPASVPLLRDDPPKPRTEAEEKRRRMIIGGAVVGGLVLIAVIAIAASGSNHPKTPVAAAAVIDSGSGAVAAKIDPPPPPVVPDAAPAIAVDANDVALEQAGSGSGSGSSSAPAPGPGSAALKPPGTGSAKKLPTNPPPPAQTAESLHKLAIQAFAKGDNKGALDLLRKAQKINPSYAPAWRVLGLVYERMGEAGQARTAYVRYLQLAPNAPDAASTRAKLDALGK